VGFWRYNADGIDVWNSRDVTIENCFIRSFDDCLVVRSTGANVRFNNCVLWCDWGKTIAVAVESGATTENVVFENLDMIRLCGHAMCIDHSCASSVHNIKFQNINVEIDDGVARPKIQENRDEQYVTKHDDDYCPWLMAISMKKNSRGSADNILFKDIEVYGNTKTRSVFRGVDEKHRIENVVIQNLRFNGKVIEDVKQANITIGSHVGSVRIGR
jgi:polygalacturonase